MSSTVSTMLKKYALIGLGAMSAIGTVSFAPNPASANTVCRVGQVLDFQLVRGQPQWTSTDAARLAGSAWRFNNNGTFVFAPADGNRELYPMRGSFQRRGNTIVFQGSSQASTNVSRRSASVQGQIDMRQNPPVLSMTWGSSIILAAVVNNTRFGRNALAVYQTSATLDC